MRTMSERWESTIFWIRSERVQNEVCDIVIINQESIPSDDPNDGHDAKIGDQFLRNVK